MGLGIARLLSRILALVASRQGVAIIGTAAVSELVTMVEIGNEANRLKSPNTTPAAADDAARTIGRMLGLDGSSVFWMSDRRTGKLLPANYWVFDIRKGRAFIISRYVPSSRYRQLRRAYFQLARQSQVQMHGADVRVPIGQPIIGGGRGFGGRGF